MISLGFSRIGPGTELNECLTHESLFILYSSYQLYLPTVLFKVRPIEDSSRQCTSGIQDTETFSL